MRVSSLSAIGLVISLTCLLTWWQFDSDVALAKARSQRGSIVLNTRCGLIEYQEAGTGMPLLMVHGSGGGHGQGIAFAGALPQQGIRVIAMSRFGYLGTPMPADATPGAQADAHACLLDALGIRQAAVMGGSAGGPSAMQMAIRHPDRVNALVLLVPLAYKPNTVADSVAPLSPWAENLILRLIGSDFVFWAALRVARDQVIKYVLATPPAQVATASPQERARVNRVLENILPVSTRAQGLRSDSLLGKGIARYALESIRAPTLVISVRDDGFGTYASAEYTASQIAGAKFVGFDNGGHLWVGHDDEVQAAIVKFLNPQAKR
jgi:2-hydroxy-6-oxonona-2,4-dienedioate hydrolase